MKLALSQRIHHLYNEKNAPWTLAGICLLGLIARLLVLTLYPDQNFPDAAGYRANGHAFFETGRITGMYMPLYVIWTGFWGYDLWVRLWDIAFSVATLPLIYGLGKRWFSPRVALLATFIAAIYPHFLFYAVNRLTETGFIFFLLLSFLFWARKQMLWGSVAFVIALLIRPTFDVMGPLLVVIFARYVHHLSWRESLLRLLQYGGVYLALMTPWWAHNYLQHAAFVRLNVGDAHVFYSGNNPLNTSGGGVVEADGSIRDLDFSEFEHLSPIQRRDAFQQAALTFIYENPGRFLSQAAVKFVRFWRLWPYTTQYQSPWIVATSLLSYGAILAFTLLFLMQEGWARRRSLMPVYLAALYLTAVHMVTIGSIRYRLPLEPFMIIFAAEALLSLYHRCMRKPLETEAPGLEVRFCTQDTEWEAARHFRQKYFFDNVPIEDPYTWTFNHPKHAHFAFYQGTEIIGYAHIQLWPEYRGAIRIIVIDEKQRGQGLGRYFLSQIEEWLKMQNYHTLHTESSPAAVIFYQRQGYYDLPFNDPDGYPTDPNDTPLGKKLL